MKKYVSWLVCAFIIVSTALLVTYFGSKAVTAIAEIIPIKRAHCIVIDAGHGGVDGGATSCSGILESKYNLEIAVRLNDLFRFLGYDTRMVRTSDISVYTKGETIAQKKISDLKERVRITNETENAILLSIHQNHYPDSRYHGAQVFYSASEGSKELATSIQDTFVSCLNKGSRRVCKKSSGIYLMEHIERPGVLIECGFLSNPQEEARLRSMEYQQKVCCVIVSATDSYLSNT